MNQPQHLYVRKASAGSGKTYTLAAHYVALLLSGEMFRSILAVTFTNKATAEMKERILGYLYAIANRIQDSDVQGFLKRVRDISKELGLDVNKLTDEHCCSEAQRIHREILSQYDEMRIQTIDAFLQTLLAGMVQKLNEAVGYQVELDIRQVVGDAVDDLVTNGASDPKICKAITAYMKDRMDDEKNWDIRKGLNEIGMELYKELLQEKKGDMVFNPTTLAALKTKLQWMTCAQAEVTQLKAALQTAERWTEADFKNWNRSYLNTLNKYRMLVNGGKPDKEADAFADFSESALSGMGIYKDENGVEHTDRDITAYRGAEAITQIQDEFLKIRRLAAVCRKAYLKEKYCTQYLNDMVLMGALGKRIDSRLKETNTRLLAETASKLCDALKVGDADFILEKAGIRYRHIMLDEFQDTSTLQWNNFSLLLQEVLAHTHGSTLIVGDIKQSIYRWRNGNWEIMANLQNDWPNQYNTNTPPLVCNFRSEKEVVKFNLETMKFLADKEKDYGYIYSEGYKGDNLHEYYRAGHEGGYVQVKCYPQTANPRLAEVRKKVRQTILSDMFSEMENLLQKGVSPRNMMVLFRQHSEAKELLDTLQEMQDNFPQLAHTPFLSNNCFRLRYSKSVNLLMAAIRYVFLEDKVALLYVQKQVPDLKLETSIHTLQTMALTDLVELLLRDCQLAGTEKDVPDLSYINCFRDQVRSYVQTHGSDGKSFVRYWDDHMADSAIPAVDMQGIRMMTIHAAKGLEAKNVFIPFCDWDMEEDKMGSKLWCEVKELKAPNGHSALLPIPQTSTMAEAGFDDEYNAEHRLQRVDNLNLLYVAITRAAERLFIYADVTKNEDSKGNVKSRDKWDVGQLLAERCEMWSELKGLYADDKLANKDNCVLRTYGGLCVEPDQSGSTTENNDPFSFAQVSECAAHCVSTDSHIEFRQSQESRQYGWNMTHGEAQENAMEQRVLGTICHNILSHIGLYETMDQASEAVKKEVEKAFRTGVIPSESLRQNIENMLVSTVTADGMHRWFTGNWHVMCEEAILLKDEHGEVEERRMDRVMWSTDRKEAVVLDYKFGQDNVKYDEQVRRYMEICRRMGATKVQGFLWIAAERCLEEVSL